MRILLFFSSSLTICKERSHQSVRHRIGKYDGRFERFGFLKVHLSIRHDDDHITDLNQTGCCTIETDASASSFTFYYIGDKASAVVVVYDVYLFTGYQVGCIHQILIDGDAAHVIEISLCNTGAMNFGFQYFYIHVNSMFL